MAHIGEAMRLDAQIWGAKKNVARLHFYAKAA